MNEIVFFPAHVLAALIRARQISAVEVVQAHLDRIAAVNPKLNAVVQLGAEAALKDAAAADGLLARGGLIGSLHGVPFTVKDWIETAGVVCTAGDERYRHYVPAQDATAVARLRQAGGIFLGKTNPVTGNSVYGRTNNPYRLDYSPSGSSSGEAAIIAAGGSPLGLGSDSGGSIRTPAHACGVAGLKPTHGRVPLTGHFPRINVMNDPRTVIGPLARSVEDLALALEIIGGVDWRDASVVPMPLGDWRRVDVASLRVATYTEHADAVPGPDAVAAVASAIDCLRDLGAAVTADRSPWLDQTYKITRDYWSRPESESWDEWLAEGDYVLSSEEVEHHLFAWDRYRRDLIAFMERYDLIVTPAMELPAQPHDQSEGGIAYTLAPSLVGYPAVVVRVGTSADGLPVGVQVVARPWRDDVALAAAAVLERRFGGWQRPPL